MTIPLRSFGFPALIAALAVGAAFRLIWVGDIEYKADEAWTFDLVRRFVEFGEGSWIGMPSSQNLLNPGLSLWVFYPLGAIFGVSEPTGLARGVQVLNVSAIVLLAVFAWRCVPAAQREPWLWAAALVSVNPLVVLFQRKIWPPSVFPVFLVGLFAAWWHRDRRGGAFVWGLLAALMAQIHLSAVFHSVALALWTFLFDRRRTAWAWWLVGLAVGSLPMVPWLDYLANARQQTETNAVSTAGVFELKFWTHWATEPLGLDVRYALGPDFREFLAGPFIGDHATHGVAALHGVVAMLGVGLFAAGLWRWRQSWPGWRATFGGRGDDTSLLLCATLWGYGLLLTATRLPFYRHYLLVTFPLSALWLARLALPERSAERIRARGRGILLGLVIAEALITLAFLAYIHSHGGTPTGDYGRSYAAQLAASAVMTPP